MVKRDTIGDLSDSLADGLGLKNAGPMEDLDIDVSYAVCLLILSWVIICVIWIRQLKFSTSLCFPRHAFRRIYSYNSYSIHAHSFQAHTCQELNVHDWFVVIEGVKTPKGGLLSFERDNSCPRWDFIGQHCSAAD